MYHHTLSQPSLPLPRVWVTHDIPLVAAGAQVALGDAYRVEPLVPTPLEDQDVVIADYEAGLALLRRHHAQRPARAPAPRCLVISETSRCWQVRQALEQGVMGYLRLDSGLGELREAVRSLHLGQRFLCTAASASMAESVTQEMLTGREQDVLVLMSEGLDNKSIALRLDIALGTVKSHVKAVLAKMAARSRTQAVAVARQRGLVQDRHPASAGR